MWASWRLIAPGRTYVPPAPGDDPVARELRALAERDRAAGADFTDWSDEERKRWLGGLHAQRHAMAHYEPVRWPERVLAPPAFKDEVVVLAVAAIAAAAGEKLPGSGWSAFALWPLWQAIDGIEEAARRRSARRLGLTAETAPRPAAVTGALFYMPLTLAPWLWRKLRGGPEERHAWSFYLAVRVIAACNERRSWRQAMQ